MSQIFRLASRSFRKQLLQNDHNKLIMTSLRPVTCKPSPVPIRPKAEGHDERNLRFRRPQSPHLTIYKPQLTALLSITHRATGMILTFYAVAFGMAAVYLPCPLEFYIDELHCACIGPAPIAALKFMLAMPLCYHFFNGIRHLIWDTGRCLSIKLVYITGYMMLALAISSAVALSICPL